MNIVYTVAGLGVLATIGLGVYGYFQGVPESDIVFATRAGNVAKVKQLLKRDPALIKAKSYPQGYESASKRLEYESNQGRSPWQGRYLIHDAAAHGKDALPMLDLLAAAGADLKVRRNGRTLLHDAANDGHVEVANWLIDHGADVNAANDCGDKCVELGWTPLHNAQQLVTGEMSQLLLARGAAVDATSASGRTALHVAAATTGGLGGAFVLCRYGADPARKDADGRTPYDLGLKPTPPTTGWRKPPDDPTELPEWLKAGGGCAKVAAVARRTGVAVPEEDARIVFSEHACARGIKEACAPK